MLKISCIIPAYNEEKNITRVLRILVPLIGTVIHEVIVVDDMSGDNTKEIVKNFSTVRLVEHLVNEGKSKTVSDGIQKSTGDYILLLDADLLYLNQGNITDLITPISNNRADVTISFRKNAWPLFPFKDIDYLSGERIFPKKHAASFLDEMAQLPGYGLEVFLNKNVIIRNQLRLAVVQWPNVENQPHYRKKGILKGARVIAKIWWNVLRTASIIEIFKQNISMRKLLVK
ncbi:MAG: glycosyltransferase [Patescibacteria group bacterium]